MASIILAVADAVALLRSAIAAPAPAASACRPSQLATSEGGWERFACSLSPVQGVTLHWSSYLDSASLALQKEGAEGWLALGFPTRPGKMYPAGALVALSNGTLATYLLSGYSVRSVTPCAKSSMPITYSAASSSTTPDGMVVRVGGLRISAADEVPLLYAMHKGETFPAYHGLGGRGGFSVDLLSGAMATHTSGSVAAVRAHGILQVLAWAFLAPVAVILKRFGVPWMRDASAWGLPLGFLAHASLMGSAAICCLSAVALAWAMFGGRALYGHGTAGVALSACVVLQVLPALFCRPDAKESPRGRRVFRLAHRGGGSFVLALALVTVCLGIKNFAVLWGPREAFAYAAATCAGLAGAACLAVGLGASIDPRRQALEDISTDSDSESGTDES